jgi:hypothetical protein
MAREQSSGASPLGADPRQTQGSREAVQPGPDRRRETVHDRGDAEREARDKFGGTNPGAAFFGWIVAIGIAVLLTSVVGAVAAAVGFSGNLSQSEAQRQAGTIGIGAAVVLLVVLMLGYYAGGYVAGRMSRFDGGRQGVMVWLIGLLVTIVAIVLGAAFGSQYNILDRVSLPRIPVTPDQLGWGAVITGVAVLLLTLLAAVMGGKVGHRYHKRVDRAAGH